MLRSQARLIFSAPQGRLSNSVYPVSCRNLPRTAPKSIRKSLCRLTNRVTSGGHQDLTYTYDQSNNLLSIGDNTGGTAWRNFQYDDLKRLSYAHGPFGALGELGSPISRQVTH